MEKLRAFMKSSIIHVNFSRSKGEKLSDGIAKIAFDHDGNMGIVRNITYLICLSSKLWHIMCNYPSSCGMGCYGHGLISSIERIDEVANKFGTSQKDDFPCSTLLIFYKCLAFLRNNMNWKHFDIWWVEGQPCHITFIEFYLFSIKSLM